MIVSTCINKGHEFTTDEFLQTCPRCRSNMQVQMITEPKALSLEIRFLIAAQNLERVVDETFAKMQIAQDEYFDTNDPEKHDAYLIANKAYEDAEKAANDLAKWRTTLDEVECRLEQVECVISYKIREEKEAAA